MAQVWAASDPPVRRKFTILPTTEIRTRAQIRSVCLPLVLLAQPTDKLTRWASFKKQPNQAQAIQRERGFKLAEMRKANPKYRGNLTRAEREAIRGMTLSGIRQSVIARELKLTAPTVSKAQRAMGLPTRLVIPEEEILRLFREGWGGHRISKHLHVPANQVYAVAHKNNFRRTDGVGYPTPKGDVPAFIEALKRRDGYIKQLARKFGVGFCQAQKIAHEVLGTLQFRPGVAKPPLSSNFPQRHFQKRVNAS
jgi:hypothetical protein